mgnify:CR=1 FL=1
MLLNINTNRIYWHAGAGKDDDKTFDRLKSEKKILGNSALKIDEHYKKYIKDFPGIVNRAPDKHIANVLGITSVSLSRIRKRIASKK